MVCVLPGSSGNVIIVGAHFDHVSKGDGVVDNWSGASLLPSLYQATKFEPRRHSYIFVGFTDEETGEVGSHFYAGKMSKEEVAATDAMVNMDTLGLAAPKVWTTHSDKRLSSALVYIGKQLNVPVTGVNVEQVGNTDSVQFAKRKIPSITIHSLTQETWNAHILHTPNDKFSAIRLDDYYQTYKLVTALLCNQVNSNRQLLQRLLNFVADGRDHICVDHLVDFFALFDHHEMQIYRRKRIPGDDDHC